MTYKTELVKNEFLRLLEEGNIKYVLLSEFIGGIGGDIDIYIPDEDRKKFGKFIKEKKLLKQKYPPKYLNHHFYFFNSQQFRPLRVHVKFEISFYDEDENIYRIFNEGSRVVEKAIRSDYGYRPYGYHAILLYAAKCGFLEKRELQVEQVKNLKKYIKLFSYEIDSSHKNAIVEKIDNSTQKFGDKEPLKLFSAKLREILRPFFQETKKVNEYSVRSNEKGIPAFSVLFLGPDGSGKSTLVKAVTKYLEVPTTIMYGGIGQAGFKINSLYYIREAIKSLRSGKIKSIGNKIWWYLLFPIEIFLRLLAVYRQGKSKLFLIDRYPDTPFRNKRMGYLWLYDFLLPQPTLIVSLTAPPKELVKRKPNELTEKTSKEKLRHEKMIRQYYSENNSSIVVLDTSMKTISECVEKIQSEIWSLELFQETLFNK